MTVLLEAIRSVVPIKYRQGLGLWTAHAVSISPLLMYPYFYLLCGTVPKNLTLLPNDECCVDYNSYKIYSPRDGILAFIEVLQDKIYEKALSIDKGDIVLDVGSYVGMFSARASSLVGDTGRVIAIEPAARNLAYMHKNLDTLNNVTIVDKAAGEYTGTVKLYFRGATPCYSLLNISKNNKHNHVPVTLDTLDNITHVLGIEHVNFIKIDTEGSELNILVGARKLLAQKNIKVAIAAYHELPDGRPELPLLVKLLKNYQFNVTVINRYIYASK